MFSIRCLNVDKCVSKICKKSCGYNFIKFVEGICFGTEYNQLDFKYSPEM